MSFINKSRQEYTKSDIDAMPREYLYKALPGYVERAKIIRRTQKCWIVAEKFFSLASRPDRFIDRRIRMSDEAYTEDLQHAKDMAEQFARNKLENAERRMAIANEGLRAANDLLSRTISDGPVIRDAD